MTTLSELYEQDGHAVLDRLAAATGAHRVYMWQIAKGLRRPSYDLAKLLVEADSRLTIDDLIARPNQNSRWLKKPESQTLTV